MIKFFRRIRQQLLKENKLSRYLIYAIGEIVLVVIGILIALSINNWNETQKELKKEHDVLIQLKEEYQTNLAQLKEKMGQRYKTIAASLSLLSDTDQGKIIHGDSLASTFANLYLDPTFDPIQNDLISSGSIRLIQNKELKQYLSNWSADVVALREVEALWSQQVLTMVAPFARETGLARNALHYWWSDPAMQTWLLEAAQDSAKTIIGMTTKSVDTQAIMDHIEFEGILATAYSYNQSGNLQSIALQQRIEKILDLLDKEIAKNNR